MGRYLDRRGASTVFAICAVWLLISICVLAQGANAAIVVDDEVAVVGESVTLSAQTKGKLFSAGGELVEFLVGGKNIGKTLSGGDGAAYKRFTPSKAALHRITVRSPKESGQGSLLVLAKGARLVLIDAEGGLMEGRFTRRPRPESQEAIRTIAKRFPVVFLQTGMLGRHDLREWLTDHGFIGAPVVSWNDGKALSALIGKGLRIRAVIGASDVVARARGQAQLLLSFDESEKAQEVRSWEEIAGKLR